MSRSSPRLAVRYVKLRMYYRYIDFCSCLYASEMVCVKVRCVDELDFSIHVIVFATDDYQQSYCFRKKSMHTKTAVVAGGVVFVKR